ncbi:FAD-dependent monooxygenase [Chitinasiproducens palmae]|uniref:2-polyprenyl-6-methoxyphenol hydroxylase n=1 Tax=Chitinasiproducens palmae TaxID=1770053 RepID=A0A1H2PIS8_9BURK|nr:FAD-dependent monooxygenase [Chitinasiproducens palmae]SDV46209.1 2-polyprenyl-6-methoxyphenol hydroxylase [Chitinasiproducens palmae]
MHENSFLSHDVIIAGAGPVGLFLACELALQRVSVLVLEQAKTADAPLKRLPFGLRGLSTASLEALYRRGLLEALVAAQRASNVSSDVTQAAHWQHQSRRPAGHFAGIQFFRDRVDESHWPAPLPGLPDRTMAVTLEVLEAVLAGRAEALGVEIRRGATVDGYLASNHEVGVCAGPERFRAAWLVGCDGGRSAVRKIGGFRFEGTAPEFTGYSVEIDLADGNVLAAGRHLTSAGMYTFTPPSTIAMVEFDGGASHRKAPIAREHVEAVLRRISGADVRLTRLQRATTWTDRACQAAVYRKGRVLLAGDAAHVHSPLGGQGLNLGLGDALNLGWKLAAAVRGDAAAGLVDSYEAERYPVAARVLAWSRAQVALMRPDAGAHALRGVLQDLMETRDGATYFAERVSGISLRYETDGLHPLIGKTMPDVGLAPSGAVDERLNEGKGVLLDFGPDRRLEALARRWTGRVLYAAAKSARCPALRVLLVRPDGIVAFASDDAVALDPIADALSRWFGTPEGEARGR